MTSFLHSFPPSVKWVRGIKQAPGLESKSLVWDVLYSASSLNVSLSPLSSFPYISHSCSTDLFPLHVLKQK